MNTQFNDDLDFEAPQRTVPLVSQPAAPIVPVSDAGTIMAVIARAAADPSVDMAKLEGMMAMYERLEAKKAEAAFNAAMSRVQSQIGRIAADRENPQTRSMYATYAALDRVVRPIYTAEGFSLSYDTGRDSPAEMVKVICYVSHRDGYTRTYSVDMPADGKGAKGGDVMTKTHAAGSAMQYGMRYLLKLIFNIAIGKDDDGNGAFGARLSDKELSTLRDMIAEWSPSPEEMKRFTGWLGVADPEDMDPKKFPDAIKALRAKIGGKK